MILNVHMYTVHALFIEMPIQSPPQKNMFELSSELLPKKGPPIVLSLHYYSYVIVFQHTKSGFCESILLSALSTF